MNISRALFFNVLNLLGRSRPLLSFVVLASIWGTNVLASDGGGGSACMYCGCSWDHYLICCPLMLGLLCYTHIFVLCDFSLPPMN